MSARSRSMSGALLKHTERLVCLNVPFVDALLKTKAQAEELDRVLTEELGTGLFDELHTLPVPTFNMEEYTTQKAAIVAASAAAAAAAAALSDASDDATAPPAPAAPGAAASAAKKARLTK
jgi:hypothetical protein